MSRPQDPAYRLRPSIELFFASDGDVYLLRGGGGEEHVIRDPDEDDRELLRRLADGPIVIPPSGRIEERVRPLIDAGAVVPARDLTALADGDAERFARQLPYLEDLATDAVEAQRALRASSIGVLGCGGLGTWAIGALACLGVGRFVLVDDDDVELSNLNRQILYGAEDLGAAKVDRAAEWVRRFDPSIEVQRHRLRVRSPSDLECVTGCDVLLLLADWPPYDLPRWVNLVAQEHGVPFMMAGQHPPLVKIGPTYVPGLGACFACHETAQRAGYPLYDELAAQRMSSPPASTTLGPASGIVGSMLAMEVLHLLVGAGPLATHDRVFALDARTFATRWETIARDPACPVCGG